VGVNKISMWYLLLAIPFIPLLVLWFSIDVRQFLHKRRGVRSPIEGQKFLRGPGQYLREQLWHWLTKFMGCVLGVVCMASISSANIINAIQSEPLQLARIALAAGLPLVTSVVFVFLSIRYFGVAQRYRRGLEGEIAVSQELNQFIARGCFVFHDIPEKSIGNIDHVIVADTGVFAIETKAISKMTSGSRSAAVECDGVRIRFPSGRESSQPIIQAQRGAAWLRRALSDALASDIPVRAIVCLPGWFVENEGSQRGEVRVRNPKRIVNVIANERNRLTTRQMKQIERWLDARCRTEEF